MAQPTANIRAWIKTPCIPLKENFFVAGKKKYKRESIIAANPTQAKTKNAN
jgi:hypothetical protein